MDEPDVAIRTQGLTKIYRGRWGRESVGVTNLDLECRRGEVFGLLGPNGAGKTTTLRLLSTVLAPTAGTAVVDGHDVIRNPHAVRASIGFLSGDTGLYPRLTAREMLTYFGRLNGMDRRTIAGRIEELAELLDMGTFLDRRCAKLSTGMKQKVNVARTVLHDPPVLVLDEPTAGLDVLAARTIVDFVRDCRRRNRCVIFSSHNMSEVRRLCDRLAIIHTGRLRFEGTVDELRGGADGDVEDAFIRVLEAAR